MPSTDQEVFEHILNQSSTGNGTPTAIDYLAFSLYAFEKLEWYRQFVQAYSAPPDQDAINRWIMDITASRFASYQQTAVGLFEDAAREYLAEHIESQKQEAVRASILAEVRAAGAFWKQLTTALITAILAPLVIGGMIAAALTYDRIVPTASELAKHLGPSSSSIDGASSQPPKQ